MSTATDGEVSLADLPTDVRPAVAHCYPKVFTAPPPWTSLCGAKQERPPFKFAAPDAEKCVVCVDMLTH